MDTRLYDVFLTGKLAEGLAREQAAERLAQLFKSAPATMLGLLTGKPQLLKRGVDKDTALKYREALQRAGVEAAFKPQAIAQPETAAPAAPQPAASQPKPAAAVVVPAASVPAAAVAPVDSAAGSLSLAPAGSDVLVPDERRPIEAASFELAHLSVAEAGAPLEKEMRVAMTLTSVKNVAEITGDLLVRER